MLIVFAMVIIIIIIGMTTILTPLLPLFVYRFWELPTARGPQPRPGQDPHLVRTRNVQGPKDHIHRRILQTMASRIPLVLGQEPGCRRLLIPKGPST